ncbi:DNA N-6-adenine-methyltransferase [Chitinophaga sp. RCC_12]|uniref:DNA N-6-adenine-methyltransferase n=1 Tax=Chitinophaga sp. RCC_12 TaxID=3239226 RepID=UPI0035254299
MELNKIYNQNGMGGHQSAKMKSDTWLTPPEIIKALGHFDLDPCTPEYMPWETADNRFTERDNGLIQPWNGRVWLNPPYGLEAANWLYKLSRHGNGIALIFARTETEMFFKYVWNKADSVLFIKSRLYFHLPDGTRAAANAGAPSCLIAYGKDNALCLQRCGIAGKYIQLK